MTELKNRFDFAFIFDVKDGNPNGDPDTGNSPRMDAETGQGLISDVCIKRKLRNYVLTSRAGKEGFDIFVKERAVLNQLIEAAWDEAQKGKAMKTAGDKVAGVESTRQLMCRKYADIRMFGGVLSTGQAKKGEGEDDVKVRKNAGQVRGPVQITFSRSVDRIFSQEHCITRMAVTSEKESEGMNGENRTMGRKTTVSYGLYLGYGFISPQLAKETGFTEEDLSVLWESFGRMFEIDRSAGRGLMSLQRLIAFKHDSALGSAPSHRLFDLISLKRKEGVENARSFSDYTLGIGSLPPGVQRWELNDSGKLFAA